MIPAKRATLSIEMAKAADHPTEKNITAIVAGSWVEYFEYCFENHIHLDRTLYIRNTLDSLDPRIRDFRWIGRYWENPLFQSLFDYIKNSRLTKRPAKEVLDLERSLIQDRCQ